MQFFVIVDGDFYLAFQQNALQKNQSLFGL